MFWEHLANTPTDVVWLVFVVVVFLFSVIIYQAIQLLGLKKNAK